MKIKTIKNIREQLGYTHLVVFGIDSKGDYHVASHGASSLNSKEASDAANCLKGMLNFPEHLCSTVPLERICGNCDYYQSYYGIPDMQDWDRYDVTGNCSLMPCKINTYFANHCSAFEPNHNL